MLSEAIPYLTNFDLPDIAKATGVKKDRLAGWISQKNHLLAAERICVQNWLRHIRKDKANEVFPLGHGQFKKRNLMRRPVYFRDRLDAVYHHLTRAALSGWQADHVRYPTAKLELLQWAGQEIQRLRELATAQERVIEKQKQDMLLLSHGITPCLTPLPTPISSSPPEDQSRSTNPLTVGYAPEIGTRKPPFSAPGS